MVLGFYMFAVHSLTTDNPFISRGILSDRNLVLGLFFMFLLGVCVLALNVILPMFLQVLRGLPVMTAGFVMAPRGLGTFASLLLAAGWMVRHFDGRIVTALGFACVAVSSYYLSTFSADVDLYDVSWAAFVNGLGIGFIWVPLTVISFETLPARHRTEASTLTTLTSLARNYGSGVGVSIVVVILSRTRAVLARRNFVAGGPLQRRRPSLPPAGELGSLLAGRACRARRGDFPPGPGNRLHQRFPRDRHCGARNHPV